MSSVWGGRFNLQEFHDRVLGEGAVPLPMLEKIVMASGSTSASLQKTR